MLETIEIDIDEETLTHIINALCYKLNTDESVVRVGKELIDEWKKGKHDPLQVIGQLVFTHFFNEGVKLTTENNQCE